MSTIQKPPAQLIVAPRVAPPAGPAYQHRQRPDNPPAAQNKPYDPVAAAARRQAALMGNAHTPPQAADKPLSAEVQARSSGSSDTVSEAAPRRAVGGFAYPQGVSCIRGLWAEEQNAAASAARAQALGAMSTSGPPRSESPRIPSGGIDAVAARATHRIPAAATELDLEQEYGSENKVAFQSARGYKRGSSGDM